MPLWLYVLLGLGISAALWGAIMAYRKTPPAYRTAAGGPAVPTPPQTQCRHCGSPLVIRGRLDALANEGAGNGLTFIPPNTPSNGASPSRRFWQNGWQQHGLHYTFLHLERHPYDFCLNCGLISGFTDVSLIQNFRKTAGDETLRALSGLAAPLQHPDAIDDNRPDPERNP